MRPVLSTFGPRSLLIFIPSIDRTLSLKQYPRFYTVAMLSRTLPQIVDVWNTDSRFGDTLGPIVVLASDGDSQRRPVLYNLAASVRSEGIGGLGGLELTDQTTSKHGLVQCYDLKHNLKRIRSRDCSIKGVQIAKEGHVLNRESYPRIFRMHDGPHRKYDSFFSAEDKWVFCFCFVALAVVLRLVIATHRCCQLQTVQEYFQLRRTITNCVPAFLAPPLAHVGRVSR